MILIKIKNNRKIKRMITKLFSIKNFIILFKLKNSNTLHNNESFYFINKPNIFR